jgi:hypothetical protein
MSNSGPVGIRVETPARANQLRYRPATTVLSQQSRSLHSTMVTAITATGMKKKISVRILTVSHDPWNSAEAILEFLIRSQARRYGVADQSELGQTTQRRSIY